MQAWWLLRAPKSKAGSSSTAAYTKARQRLEPATIRGIGEHLIERLEARVQPSQLWLGRHVRVVDGTTVSMPDTLKTKRNIYSHRPKRPVVDFPRCESSASSRWPAGH